MPTWTTDPPAVPGYYFWRAMPGGVDDVVRVSVPGVTAFHRLERCAGLVAWQTGAEMPVPAAEMGGEWWGPVVPPGDGGAVVSDSDRGPATADGQPWKGV